MSEIPLYGAKAAVQAADPIYWLRPIFASVQGSLMEVGILPIVTSGYLFQLLGGFQILNVNFDLRADRELFQSAQKLMAICLAIAQSLLIVLSGAYGLPAELGASGILLVASQLSFGGVLLIFMDELLQKGYGFAPAVTQLSVLSISQQFLWNSFSFVTVDKGRGKEYTGAFVSLVSMLFSRNFKVALMEAFYRTNLPNMFEMYGSVVVFAIVVYFLSFRLDINVKSTRARTPSTTYPVRLLYTAHSPLMAYLTFVANLFITSASVFRMVPFSTAAKVFGTWEPRADRLVAVSGLCYYLRPPLSIMESLRDPIRTVIYITFILTSCIVLAKAWTRVSGSSPKDVARMFKENSIVILGHRESSVYRELKRIIPSAAAIGGAVVGVIVVVADLLGLASSASAIIIAISSVYGFFEILAQEGGSQGMGSLF